MTAVRSLAAEKVWQGGANIAAISLPLLTSWRMQRSTGRRVRSLAGPPWISQSPRGRAQAAAGAGHAAFAREEVAEVLALQRCPVP